MKGCRLPPGSKEEEQEEAIKNAINDAIYNGHYLGLETQVQARHTDYTQRFNQDSKTSLAIFGKR